MDEGWEVGGEEEWSGEPIPIGSADGSDGRHASSISLESPACNRAAKGGVSGSANTCEGRNEDVEIA